MKNEFDPIIEVSDDTLETPDVGEWAEKKYRLIGAYCNIFTTSMKSKWDHLLYIDLFAGSGYARIKSKRKIIMSSPLIALALPKKFTEYIFCEKDHDKCEALKERVSRFHSDLKIHIIEGDCNEQIDKIISHIPSPSKNNTVLSFSFVDPYSLNLNPYSLNLNFTTIKKLGRFAMDFLILLAFGMDAKRNMKTYLQDNNQKITTFLADDKWREKFLSQNKIDHLSFVQFLAKEFKINIQKIGYQEVEDFHEIRSIDKNLPLYHLAFFSKHTRGNDFWKKIQKYSDNQQSLF